MFYKKKVSKNKGQALKITKINSKIKNTDAYAEEIASVGLGTEESEDREIFSSKDIHTEMLRAIFNSSKEAFLKLFSLHSGRSYNFVRCGCHHRCIYKIYYIPANGCPDNLVNSC